MGSFLFGLLLLTILSIVSNLYLPVPLTPTTIWMGQFHHPYIVILVSSISTVIGWLIFYRLLYKGLNRQNRFISKLPNSYFDFFGKHTLWWVFLINALPFPLDFIRLIAVANQCTPMPLACAIGLGRLIRNSLLVFLGAWLFQYQQWFVGTLVALFVVPLVISGINALRQRLSHTEAQEGLPQPDPL